MDCLVLPFVYFRLCCVFVGSLDLISFSFICISFRVFLSVGLYVRCLMCFHLLFKCLFVLLVDFLLVIDSISMFSSILVSVLSLFVTLVLI